MSTDKSSKHYVKVTLTNGQMIEGDLFQVDAIEKWLDMVETTHPIPFSHCASVMDGEGNDLLKEWAEKA